jgi:hypothetical protein
LVTVGFEQPTTCAIRSAVLPSAAHNTIRARSTIGTSELTARTILRRYLDLLDHAHRLTSILAEHIDEDFGR